MLKRALTLCRTTSNQILCAKLIQKRFYTRGTLRRIRIPRLAKIPTLYRNWLRSLKQKRVHNLSCLKDKGGGKDIYCSEQNAMLFIDLL